jgi:plasmid stabilization system protein ParE
MKLRYTATASRELDQAISYFLENAPSYTEAFIAHIEAATARLLEYPLGAQESDMPGIRRAYVRRREERSLRQRSLR